MKSSFFASALVLALTLPAGLSAFDMGSAMDAASSMTTPTDNKTSEASSLIDTLTQTLGVTSAQATGGTAALLNEAKGNMDASSFSSLLSSVPGLSSLTGSGTSLSGASLVQQFSALGMDSGMIDKFTTIVLDYVKNEGGTQAMSLLKSALGG